MWLGGPTLPAGLSPFIPKFIKTGNAEGSSPPQRQDDALKSNLQCCRFFLRLCAIQPVGVLMLQRLSMQHLL